MTHSLRRRRASLGLAATALVVTTGLVAPAAASPGSIPPGQSQGAGWGNLAFPDPTTLTLTETLKGLETGKFTSVDLVKAYLARIEEFEPYYNAFTQMSPNALVDAAASDARREKGHHDVGALDGVPIVIKDSMDVKGMPTTSGWPLTSPISKGISLIPEKDAPVVARLRAAGAVFLGKTNLPILAGSGNNANNSAYGPTYDALNKEWAPGGSSSGSAMSVAGGFAVSGLAEETGGSIQNPASAESLYAVKPTFGLVPTTGNFPLAGAWRDVIGPLAQSPEDAALMLDVMAGPTPDDPKTASAIVPPGGYTSQLSTHALEGKRIGLYGPGWRSGPTGVLSPETGALYADAVAKLTAQGATVLEDPFAGSGFADLRTASPSTSGKNNYGIEQYLERLGPSAAVHSVEELNDWADTHGFQSDTRIDGMLAGAHLAPDMSAVTAYRDEYDRIFDKVMDDNHLDALVFPQQYQEQGPIFGGTIAATTVSEINWAQLPGVVVPDGSYASGKPFNLIIVDKKFSEAEMLGYAYDFAKAYGGRIINHDLEATPGPTAP